MSSAMPAICFAACLALSRASAAAMAWGWDWDGVEMVSGGTHVVLGGSYWTSKNRDYADAGTLYLQTLAGGERRVLHRFAGQVNEFIAAPQGGLLAVSENIKGEPRMVILDADGSVRDTLPAVQVFSWSPDGKRIAYISGTDTEGGMQPTGTWIYDTATRQSRRIDASGHKIAWADWDGCVYIEDLERERVLRFDPRSGSLSDTTHRGIYFSPDGRYYFRTGGEGDFTSELFRREGDVQVPLEMSTEEMGRKGINAAKGWLGPDQLIVASTVADVDYLFDLTSGSRARADGRLLPIRGRTDRVVVVNGTSISERSVDSLPKR